MQQQAGPMFPVMPSLPPNSITTEQIQKYLDENKKLILAILENQNLGKLAECAQYQAQLQKNLMYLAAIADAQPQAPAAPPQMQMAHHPSMQQGGFYMQHPQAMAQQPSVFPSRPQTMQDPHLTPPHVLMPIRPTTANEGMNRMLTEHIHGVGGGSSYINGNKKQEKPDGSSVAGDKEEPAK